MYLIGGIIALVAGIGSIPLSVWQQQEARNELIESIYTYNYNCACLSNFSNRYCKGFYTVRKIFLEIFILKIYMAMKNLV